MKNKIWEDNIKCDRCGYQNHEKYIKVYGTCHLCGKVLDEKAKYKYEMIKKLHLYKGKRNAERIKYY